ncbi:hypothetical protein BDW22DRAFT_1363061, partial [Trametopsis cervina]
RCPPRPSYSRPARILCCCPPSLSLTPPLPLFATVTVVVAHCISFLVLCCLRCAFCCCRHLLCHPCVRCRTAMHLFSLPLACTTPARLLFLYTNLLSLSTLLPPSFANSCFMFILLGYLSEGNLTALLASCAATHSHNLLVLVTTVI